MKISRHVLMGDPACFQIKHGVNPHTRNRWGMRKKVDRVKAREQWQGMKETLESYGIKVHVIPPHEELPGLVFPANAGFVPQLDEALALSDRDFVLARLNQARRQEAIVNEVVARELGMNLHHVLGQFEGQADLIQWGDRYLFTHGRLITPHFTLRLGFPPWRRVYGFRSDVKALGEIERWIPIKRTLSLELCDERFYHGDTILYSIGPSREYLLLYRKGLMQASLRKLGDDQHIIPLSDADALAYAANSFQVMVQGQCTLFMPLGISAALRREIEAREVQVVTLDVSEFLEKGGGSVKCMVGDLGQAPP